MIKVESEIAYNLHFSKTNSYATIISLELLNGRVWNILVKVSFDLGHSAPKWELCSSRK
jgi:hypothetical protein